MSRSEQLIAVQMFISGVRAIVDAIETNTRAIETSHTLPKTIDRHSYAKNHLNVMQECADNIVSGRYNDDATTDTH